MYRYGEFRVVTEPHGNLPTLGYQADVLIMPVVSQSIGPYPLVNGVREAVDAARQLRPRLFVPLENGEIDSRFPVIEGLGHWVITMGD